MTLYQKKKGGVKSLFTTAVRALCTVCVDAILSSRAHRTIAFISRVPIITRVIYLWFRSVNAAIDSKEPT